MAGNHTDRSVGAGRHDGGIGGDGPVSALSVETTGCGLPAGQMLRKPKGEDGTTVALMA
jgi:hypothetical protein